MTKSEYQELVEFLGAKFQRIDERFELVEQAVRHNGVLIEGNTHSIRGVAEGVMMLDEKLERFRAEIEARLP
jgi:hypothetical protein